MARDRKAIIEELAQGLPEDQRDTFIDAVMLGNGAREQADIALGFLRASASNKPVVEPLEETT